MRALKILISAGLALAMVACGGGGGGGGGAPAPAPTYTVSGSISGLLTGEYVVLLDNGANATTFTANGTHSYTGAIPAGTAYAITVQTQPVGETCTVTNGTGTVSSANVTNVTVTCVPNSYTIGGTVSGLANGDTVILQNNGGDNNGITANGSFNFAQPVASGSNYAVTVLTAPVGKSCVVTNGSGKVAGANVSNVQVVCSTNYYNVTVTVTGLPVGKSITLQNNGGDDLIFHANGSASFNTPLTQGSPFLVTISSSPSPYSCTLTNASGSVGTSNVAVGLDCPHYVYVTNKDDNTISIYQMNNTTGALSELTNPSPAGSPFPTVAGPYAIAANPAADFLYVASAGGSGVQAYSIDSNSGALTALNANTPYGTGGQPRGLAFDPLGKFLYVANFADSTVSAYTSDTNLGSFTGTLTTITGSPFTADVHSFTVAVTPDGTLAYVANSDAYDISGYSIDAASGALTSVGSPFVVAPLEVCPFIAIDPSGGYLLATGNTSGKVYVFAITPSTASSGAGTLTALAGNTVNVGANPSGIAFHPAGKFVYVANYGDNPGTVSAFAFSSTTGVLTPITGSPFTAGSSPESLTVDPTGQFLYVMNSVGNNISAFTINGTTGALTAVGAGPFTTGLKPQIMSIR